MVFQITASVDDPRTLTQVVLQVTTMLDMLQAELARVLQVNCGDIGLLSSGRRVIEAGTLSWTQARLFVRFYQGLYARMNADGGGNAPLVEGSEQDARGRAASVDS
ncbi:MAG: hypothetical protein WBN57_12915 [Gammaproteobacteria bacterium]